jgi:hypothetical protein
MRHFSQEEWADFARNVIGKDEKRTMQSHLESGCGKCSRALALWQRVSTAARREQAFQPPETAIRTVKGMYAIHRPRLAPEGKRSVVQLLFDSWRSPLPAGVRSVATATRQLLYGVGDYRVDVRIEPQLDSEKVSIVGQVLNSTDPGKALEAIPVVLLKGRKVIAGSMTNRFGEFHFDCDLVGGFRLRVELSGDAGLSVPLVDPILEIEHQVANPDEFTGVKDLFPGLKKRTRRKV